MQNKLGPLFGMSKAEMVDFSIEMGCGTSVRTIPHVILTTSDLANYASIQRGQAPGPLLSEHDHYDEESDANTDLTDEFVGFRVFTAGDSDVAFDEDVEELVFSE